MDGICKLCGKQRELRESHIIPSFVIQWLKESSATGFIRFGEILNRRVQDGLKKHLLCEECEQLFSGFEKSFSEEIFQPSCRGNIPKETYGSWLLKFATSVSWRVLTSLEKKILSTYPEHHKKAAGHALEEKWLRKLRQPYKWKTCSREALGIGSKKGARR